MSAVEKLINVDIFQTVIQTVVYVHSVVYVHISYQDLGFSYKILLSLEFLDKILESLTSSKKS